VSPRSQLGKRRLKDTLASDDLIDTSIKQTNQLNPEESAQSNLNCLSCKPLAFMIFEYCPKMDLFNYVAEGYTRGNERLCHALFY